MTLVPRGQSTALNNVTGPQCYRSSVLPFVSVTVRQCYRSSALPFVSVTVRQRYRSTAVPVDGSAALPGADGRFDRSRGPGGVFSWHDSHRHAI